MLLRPDQPATVTILLAKSIVLRNKLQTVSVALAVAAAVAVFVLVLPLHLRRLASIPVLGAGFLVFAIAGRVCNAIACRREAAWIAELGASRPGDAAALDEAITALRLRRRFL